MTHSSSSPSAEDDLHLEHEIFVLDAHLERMAPSDEQVIRSFMKQLLRTLGMEELAPFGWYPAADLRAPGFSFIQPITTSHISGHYFDKPGPAPHLHMDFYSCKHFDWRGVIGLVHETFGLTDWTAHFILRSVLEEPQSTVIRGKGTGIVSEQQLRAAPARRLVAA